MRETLKEYGKFYLGCALIIYAILSLIFKNASFFDLFDTTITITTLISILYVECLWKFNPFDKTPKLYGEYNATFISNFDKKKNERKMNLTIKQNLFSTRIYIITDESKSESISSSLIKKTDCWQLIYTYCNIPNAIERNHSCIHFGTSIFNISKNNLISGIYYTDRNTSGDIKNIKKIK